MRNPPAAFKHSDPTHLDFGKTADSSLLTKKRRNFATGGMVTMNLGGGMSTSEPIDDSENSKEADAFAKAEAKRLSKPQD